MNIDDGSFSRVYLKQTTATAKQCFICYRPTTTVLATINAVDFLYTCDGHLKDRGFASKIDLPSGSGEEKPKVNEEEIRRVKEEWEEKQRLKEKAKDEDKDKDKDKASKEASSKSKSTPPAPTPMPVVSTTPKPTHERYVLHRDIWAMRLAEHKKRRQTTAVKQVAPRLPIAPRTAPVLPPPPSSSPPS